MTRNNGVLIGALAALCLLCASTASAQIGFNGAYDYATWVEIANPMGGSGFPLVNTIDGPQQTLTLYEPNLCGGGGEESVGPDCYNDIGYGNDFTHAAMGTGTVSFNWSFNWDVDDCCSGANVYINSTLYNLANGYFGNIGNNTAGDASGTFSVAVNAGDIITLEAFSEDDCCGAASFVISNFSAPATPEPASMLLFVPGLLGLGIAVLKRHRAA